jgi:hypothetical protein
MSLRQSVNQPLFHLDHHFRQQKKTPQSFNIKLNSKVLSPLELNISAEASVCPCFTPFSAKEKAWEDDKITLVFFGFEKAY